MYDFVDTVPGSGTGSTSTSIQTIFNGFNLDELLTDEAGSFITLTVSGRSDLTQRIRTIEVNGMDGLMEEEGATLEPREITVKYKVKDETNEGLRKRFEKLNSLLVGSKKELVFTDEDAIFYATMQMNEIPEEESNDLVGTITFLCSDPYKYGPEKTMEPTSDNFIVENNGTAEADPIFELTATEKATFAMISNGVEEYNLIGTPSDDDVQVVDTRTSVLYENGSTIDTWSPAPLNMVETQFIDSLDGVMGSDGAGIRPNSWGTPGQKQRGAGVFKELSTPIQDFEIESTFDIISTREADNFRMGIMLFDENMNNIGMVGIKDNSKVYKRRVPLARVGEYRGGGLANGYLIGDVNKIDNARDTTLFYLRVKREGTTFNFYIGEWQNQRHVRRWESTYHDLDNQWTGRLKFVSLYITSFQDRTVPTRARINSVEIFELATVTEDQTPYILYPGDVVTFDHKDDDILVNGEPRMDLKNFGGSFFKLKKGENMLTVTPEDTFDTRVTFRDKYL